MMRSLLPVLAVFACVSGAVAQERRFHYPAPPESSYRVTKDVQYGTSGSDALRMDIYRPATGGRAPTLIFLNVASGENRGVPFYVAWAQLAASKGLTAIIPDLRRETVIDDAIKLVVHLSRAQQDDNGVDPSALAVYAGSGNVSYALPFVQNARSTMIKSAVMYYGAAEVENFRIDLPLLFVRAGLDRPPVNAMMARLASTASAQNAPVTLLNHPTGRHGFEAVNNDDLTREVIDQTIEFVKRTTASSYQTALRAALPEAVAAGHVTAGRPAAAAAAYAQLVAARPDDSPLRLAYGEALLANSQFAEACAELDKLKGKGLGYRDLGIPAARACMQKGDAAAAIAWLESIPLRFRPSELQNDPIFTPIRDRSEFKALFPPR
jgi:dienelactone hydrolase